jgi:alginate O-acetyltransferase complex protein AlgI
MYAGLVGVNGIGLSDALTWQITPDRWGGMVLAGIAVYLPLLKDRIMVSGTAGVRSAIAAGAYVLAPIACLALGIVLLYSRDAVPFLYFQF